MNELTEQFYCPNTCCGAAIPRTHVRSKIDPRTGVRQVRILCCACDQAFEASYRLRGGMWCQESDPRRIENAKSLRGLRTAIERIGGKLEAMSA